MLIVMLGYGNTERNSLMFDLPERKVHYAHDQSGRVRRHKVANTLCAMNSDVPESHITTDPDKVTCRICQKDKRFAVIKGVHETVKAQAPSQPVAPFGGLVPGKRRYRVNWRGKVILQVADVVPTNYDPSCPWDIEPRGYAYRWRDARAEDITETLE